MDVLLNISTSRHPDRTSHAEPVTVGVPFPRGALLDTAALALADDDGEPVPLQAVVTDLWPDGSVRWALLDFQVVGPAVADRRFRLTDHAALGRAAGPRVTVLSIDGGVAVDTGATQFRLRAESTAILDDVSAGGSSRGAAAIATVTAADGRAWPLVVRQVTHEFGGTLRSVVRLDATAGPARRPLVQAIVRVHFFAGSAAVRLAITLRNPRRAKHPGGIWELGDPGSVYLRDVSVTFPLPGRVSEVTSATESPDAFAVVPLPFALYQDSSGGENWAAATHVNRHGEVPLRFRGYQQTAADARVEGLRATPALSVAHGPWHTGVAMEHFWQNFPKALEVEDDAVVLRLWPRQHADVHELQGGEQKTHHFVAALGQDPIARDARHWGRSPSLAAPTPEWYAASRALPHLSPRSGDHDPRYGCLVDAAISGDDAFERKREIIDQFGWRHFGDVYADHENAFAGAAVPIVSHYNNQYDGIAGLATQFMRSGDARWWRLMTEMARHVADVDIYHTREDKAAFNGGLFWHTFHYVDAARSSHRSYPRHPKIAGGGPANENNYAAGLRLHWLLTGDPESRDAAIGLARWVVNMDDGRRTVLRWISDGPTGLASATRSPDYHAPGRGAGHSILALLEGHKLTRDRQLLDKAEELIARCVHPGQDIDALTLLDAEQRWSYVVFLQALGKYLEYKSERAEVDRAYAYARASLLHYARWMAIHEYPYLRKPEILEFPTETWAAQDMRKCEVFLYAAQHAAGAERERFLERAAFFFDDSVSTLLESPTRALARPVILLLSNGFMFLSPDATAAAPVPDPALERFDPHPVFVYQKAAAKRRLLAGVAVFAALFVLVIAAVAAIVF